LADRLTRDIGNGDLSLGTYAAELTSCFETIVRGMAIKARDDATRSL
jgi:hypothetical protein